MLFAQETITHSVGQFVNDMVCAHGIDSFRSTLKRGQHETRHDKRPKQLNLHLGEYSGCHCDLPTETIDQISHRARVIDGKRLCHADRIAPNGLPS